MNMAIRTEEIPKLFQLNVANIFSFGVDREDAKRTVFWGHNSLLVLGVRVNNSEDRVAMNGDSGKRRMHRTEAAIVNGEAAADENRLGKRNMCAAGRSTHYLYPKTCSHTFHDSTFANFYFLVQQQETMTMLAIGGVGRRARK
jgi:hypothetical protein